MKISLSDRDLALAIVVAGLLTSCGDEKVSTSQTPLSRTPVSVRGWIAGIAQSTSEQSQPEMAAAQQHYELIASTNMSVEGAPYASGGLAENGSFLILDAPAGRIVIFFIVPGQPEARLILENIPGNADVLIPGLILKGASVEIRDPAKLLVRIPSKARTRKAVSSQATIGGHPAPTFEVPIPEMRDRRDYPQPDQGLKPLAIVR